MISYDVDTFYHCLIRSDNQRSKILILKIAILIICYLVLLQFVKWKFKFTCTYVVTMGSDKFILFLLYTYCIIYTYYVYIRLFWTAYHIIYIIYIICICMFGLYYLYIVSYQNILKIVFSLFLAFRCIIKKKTLKSSRIGIASRTGAPRFFSSFLLFASLQLQSSE